MKPLLPSMRERQRYLVYEVLSESPLQGRVIQEALLEGLQQFLGELGMAKAGVQLLDQAGQRGILRTNSKEISNVKAGLSLVKHINQQKVAVRTLGVSGLHNKALRLCTDSNQGRK
ncbi:MAG TPA: Rpp14/Pop5 family protein [Candidatus Nanoarchaeia archaeon]|nr:Rpp14/Pop5 family protein [Candidatus Nanoarchaeia archaeon]